MFTEERQSAIEKCLRENGKVKVKELSEMFQVTEDCIRKDLKTLENAGKLKRTTPLQPTYLTISLKCSVQSSGRYSHKFPTRLSPAGSSLSVFPMLLFPICAFLYHISASIQIQNLFVKEFITILFIFHQLKALMYSP